MIPDYQSLLDGVMAKGQLHESRIGETREQLGVRVSLDIGEMVSRKGMHRPLAWIETLQIMGGYFDLDQIKEAAPNAKHDWFNPTMSYGPRVARQVQGVVRQLGMTPETRRAIIHMCGEDDGYESDKPCTVLLQPFIRDRTLDMFVYMRSWDLINGLAYDTMMYSGVAMFLAHCLFVKTGRLTVFAGSGHIYAQDYKKVEVYKDFKKHFALDTEVLPPEPMELMENMKMFAVHYLEKLADGDKLPPFGFRVFDVAE